MATQWAPDPLHSKGKIRVSLLQEVLFALLVHSLGVTKYGHYTAQARKSLLLTLEQQIRHFSFWESRGLVMSMVTSKLLSQCVVLAAHQPYKISTL